MKKVVCFGEILWDNLPSGPLPGGAPMNVSYHLHQLGIQAEIISSTGEDMKGKTLKKFLSGKGLTLDLIQEDKVHDTGEVQVSFNNKGEPEYGIVFPVAWDFIKLKTNLQEAVSHADTFVYGTLAARNPESRNTLLTLLESTSYKVMDVNLRRPHFTPQLVIQLISKCDLLKVNEEEFGIIHEWLNFHASEPAGMAENIFKLFEVKEIILTMGSAGALYFNRFERLKVKPSKVKVADTVGSGDSFLAGFISEKLNGKSNLSALKFATALASLVTSHQGACPDYALVDVNTNAVTVLDY